MTAPEINIIEYEVLWAQMRKWKLKKIFEIQNYYFKNINLNVEIFSDFITKLKYEGQSFLSALNTLKSTQTIVITTLKSYIQFRLIIKLLNSQTMLQYMLLRPFTHHSRHMSN